ncbi:MAG: PD-(D/E)XK nuclease family protein [Planctomycetota bacterium]
MLAEHYYEEPVVDRESGEAASYGKKYLERVERSVATFFAAPELAAARASDPATWLACEELGTIELFDTKVYAVPDFALRDDGGVVILDWKTGRPRERDRFQLALYALYAERTWGADPTEVRCADAYLDEGSFEETTFGRAELDDVLATIETSIARMRELHFDADRSAGDAAEFPMLPEGSRECARCNFREMCGR